MRLYTLPSSDGAPIRTGLRPISLIGRDDGQDNAWSSTVVGACVAGLCSRGKIANLASSVWLKCAAAATAVAALVPKSAFAHVKWFEPYDVTKTPVPVGGVLTSHFLLIFVGFVLLLAGSFLLDRFAAAKLRMLSTPGRYANIEERLMQAGTGAFFMALFATGGIILTPELQTKADWPAWLQLGIAISMLSTRTCALGSLGILVLYAYGVALYGFFHLSDYPMFIGLAVYLGLTSFSSARLRSWRMPALYISICISLMWGAIEKFAYPQWTFPLLAARPYLTLGMSPDVFMVVAGFVEFTFAFYILTGFGLLRLAILGLGMIFTAAIFDFGKVDAIGHLPILVPMAAMFLHGPTQLHAWLHDESETVISRVRNAGTVFATTVFFFFAAYYGMQQMEYGKGLHSPTMAALASPAQSQKP